MHHMNTNCFVANLSSTAFLTRTSHFAFVSALHIFVWNDFRCGNFYCVQWSLWWYSVYNKRSSQPRAADVSSITPHVTTVVPSADQFLPFFSNSRLPWIQKLFRKCKSVTCCPFLSGTSPCHAARWPASSRCSASTAATTTTTTTISSNNNNNNNNNNSNV
jgi:hypothetical protein